MTELQKKSKVQAGYHHLPETHCQHLMACWKDRFLSQTRIMKVLWKSLLKCKEFSALTCIPRFQQTNIIRNQNNLTSTTVYHKFLSIWGLEQQAAFKWLFTMCLGATEKSLQPRDSVTQNILGERKGFTSYIHKEPNHTATCNWLIANRYVSSQVCLQHHHPPCM